MREQTEGNFHCNRFKGKVGIVTGAGQGIGRAVSIRLASEGAFVGVLDWNIGSAEETLELIQNAGGAGLALQADVSNPQQVQDSVHKIFSISNRFDMLVNNAGLDRPGGFLKLSDRSFLEVLGVHIMGTVHCVKECVPLMIKQGDGRIVNLSSIYGKVGTKGESPYCTAKAGLIGLTKALAREFASKGVRVNAVMPGLTATPTIRDMMSVKYQEAFIRETPMGRMAEPDEIAAPISFLLSDEAGFITGAVLEVTGGWGM